MKRETTKIREQAQQDITPSDTRYPGPNEFIAEASGYNLTAHAVIDTIVKRRAIVEEHLNFDSTWKKQKEVIQESRKEDQELSKLLDLYPAEKKEISGPGGAPIPFGLDPEFQKLWYEVTGKNAFNETTDT